MKEMSKQFLELFFNPGETICVSPDKYGYHSVEQDALNGKMVLTSPSENSKPKTIVEDDINLMALNPISGFRRDETVTAFRSFLIELDEGETIEQKKYIEDSGLPYSVCVFSGNKSLHYGIVLKSDLVSIGVWRLINNWILNILDKADQQTKNPSRSIRFPGNKRKDGKQLMQSMVDFKGRVSETDLYVWLNRYPDKKPKLDTSPVREFGDSVPQFDNMPKWFVEKLDGLRDGSQLQRNNTWFELACFMSSRNFELDEIENCLDPYFVGESDFTRREWLTCLKSGYKRGSS